jgi:hypothetical protein
LKHQKDTPLYFFWIGPTLEEKADLGQRYTANELYISDKRAVVEKYNEVKKTNGKSYMMFQ